MSDNLATVVRVHNPFDPSQDRQLVQCEAGFTIQSWIDDNDIVFDYPVLCLVGGEPIMRERWPELIIEAGYTLVFFHLPEGGGGDGKNPLQTLLGFALIATSLFIPGLSVLTKFVLSGAGSLLLAKGLIPTPEVPTVDHIPDPSPTYSLGSQGNLARLGKAIPVIYGHHKVYPDFGAKPYSAFINNDQFLYHHLIIGQGEYELNGIFIGDTPIERFKEITWQKVEPGGTQTLFDSNVIPSIEVARVELNYYESGHPRYDEDVPAKNRNIAGPFIINPIGTTTDRIDIDFELLSVCSRQKGGPIFPATAGFRVYVRPVDDLGKPIKTRSSGTNRSPWWSKVETLTESTNETIRLTYSYPVSGMLSGFTRYGRFEIQVRRETPNNVLRTFFDRLNLVGAKAFITDDDDADAYRGLTVLAVKMLATENLSGQSSRRINVLVTRKLPIWSPTRTTNNGWSLPTATRSISWALADMLRNPTYGTGWDDSRMDLQELYDLEKVHSKRGDEFNGVFDRQISMQEALKLTSRVGRCAGVLPGGKFRAIRDRLQTIPVAVFGMGNIVKNSFRINYATAADNIADGITVEFVSPVTYKPEEVTVGIDGAIPENPARVKLFGCTNLAQATREAKYLLAAHLLRRTTIKLTTELEGYIPTFGDLIEVNHDISTSRHITGYVTGVGPRARIIPHSNNRLGLRISEEIELTIVQPNSHGHLVPTNPRAIVFSTRDGSPPVRILIRVDTDIEGEQTIYFSDDNIVWPSSPHNGIPEGCAEIRGFGGVGRTEPVKICFDDGEEPTRFTIVERNKPVYHQYCVVKSIRPRGENHVELETLLEKPEVHEV